MSTERSKRIVECYFCKEGKRFGLTYKARVEMILFHPLTGEPFPRTITTRVCKKCVKEAGYIVKEVEDENNST